MTLKGFIETKTHIYQENVYLYYALTF